MEEIKKTSGEWEKELQGVVIIDPDGWDRSNFYHSWNELITKEEFDKRLMSSTCKYKLSKLNKTN